ncbi:COG1470 family protein [Cellulomonas sp. URHB0016]
MHIASSRPARVAVLLALGASGLVVPALALPVLALPAVAAPALAVPAVAVPAVAVPAVAAPAVAAPARAVPALALPAVAAAAVPANAGSVPSVSVRTGAASPPPAPQPAAADPAGTVTWTVQPATADGPDGRVSLRHSLDPGASATDHVTVTNFSDHDATFVVYAGDGTVNDTGDFDVPPGEDRRKDGGAWIELGQPDGTERLDDGRLQLTLGPAATATIPLTITVPTDATPGDHPAGVVAELVDDGASVRLAARVGTRVHLRVTGDLKARLVPADVRPRWEPSWNPFAPGTVHVRYVVRNAGNVRLGARSTVSLAGPAGAGAVEATTEVREVLPDRSAVVEATLPAWPLLRLAGRVDATPVVVGEDIVDAPLRHTSAAVTVWTPPWSQLLLVLVLAGVAVLVPWQRRRSARRVQAQVDAALAAAGVARETPSETVDAGGT